MGKPNRASQEKRNRERAQKERQQEKVSQRVVRKGEKEARTLNMEEGFDPDLVGIFPGPQPVADEY